MHVAASETRIARLRVTSGERDALALRLKLARAFSSSTLRPYTLPAHAILCVRHLRDPLPGTIRLDYGSAHVPTAWQSAMRSSLDDLVRRAVRPAREPVTAGADAVLFADRSELLACLTADRCDGTVTDHWWWGSLLSELHIESPLPTLWLDAPEYAPAALHHLAVRRKATAFARTLTEMDARAILQRITVTCGLSDVWAALDAGIPGSLDAMERAGAVDAAAVTTGEEDMATGDQDAPVSRWAEGTGAVSPAFSSSSESGAAPWHHWVPESAEGGLLPAQQQLLGVGLMLSRSPSFIRTATFARAVRQWHSTPTSVDSLTRRGTPVAATVRPQESAGSPDSARGPQGDSSLAALQRKSSAGSDIPFAAPEPAFAIEVAALPADGGTGFVTRDGEHLAARTKTVPKLSPPESSEDSVSTVANVFDEEIETDLGGLFYLINLGLFLGLYGDFTTPSQPGISLSIWDFLALLGHRLLGGRWPDDPVWALLGRLAGRRAGEEPGTGFAPPRTWRLPPDWLLPFPEVNRWEWSTTAGRFRVWHPAGFLVLDEVLDPDRPEKQLFQDMQIYPTVPGFEPRHIADAADEGQTPLDRWLSCLTPYVRARLSRAFGSEIDEDAAEFLCVQRARVTTTISHLDVTLLLADLYLPIRFAGLDRDPGWVPAAGRIITFHFE